MLYKLITCFIYQSLGRKHNIFLRIPASKRCLYNKSQLIFTHIGWLMMIPMIVMNMLRSLQSNLKAKTSKEKETLNRNKNAKSSHLHHSWITLAEIPPREILFDLKRWGFLFFSCYSTPRADENICRVLSLSLPSKQSEKERYFGIAKPTTFAAFTQVRRKLLKSFKNLVTEKNRTDWLRTRKPSRALEENR